jgi:MFS family permease
LHSCSVVYDDKSFGHNDQGQGLFATNCFIGGMVIAVLLVLAVAAGWVASRLIDKHGRAPVRAWVNLRLYQLQSTIAPNIPQYAICSESAADSAFGCGFATLNGTAPDRLSRPSVTGALSRLLLLQEIYRH